MSPPEEEQDLEDQDADKDVDAREDRGGSSDALAAAERKGIVEQGRIEILKGQKFITKEPNYETSLFSKWENINKKFHLLGWKHLRSWRAYVEMFSELQAFLYEITGNVPRDQRAGELAFLEAELAAIRQRPQRIRIPLMYNLASHLFYNSELGLKHPGEKSIFDLDVKEIFRKHEDRIRETGAIHKQTKEILKP